MGVFRKSWGRNTAVLGWVAKVVAQYNLTRLTSAVLYFIATNTSFRVWRKFFVCIDTIRRAVGCSRSSVDRALKTLRELHLIKYDGQVHVGKPRPVAVYRLSGTPDCPLPEWVVQAREEALTSGLTHRTKNAGPAVYATPKPTPAETPSPSTSGLVSTYRPALPVKTGPKAEPQPVGSVRRPTHLRRLRSAVWGLWCGGGAPVPTGGVEGSQDGAVGFSAGAGEALGAPSTGEVTYWRHPARGTHMTTSTEAALFTIPTPPAPKKPDTTLEFETFWAHYPRRTGKGAARKAFQAATLKAAAADIIDAAAAYGANCRAIRKETQFIPHPATWLNQERWDDDLEPAPQVRSRVDDAVQAGMELVNFYRQQELHNPAAQKAISW